ncbi:periplasmic binding protein-like I [Rhizoclosmatium globosum]|uniref:Periplasmic binding protein-like I n=1 Tax=Rhizoclosmatium globosum TaxID=329046 RepID=A0A1Y2CW85_9FUNG|nr:periplasmic binding protein-like I [Rhizoclosmatium globosum]|eukprot:ORY51281.1 periplasmic binding protein-like I [Rhizoclosmatium globosum]
MVAAKQNITLGFVGYYCVLKGLALNGSLVTNFNPVFNSSVVHLSDWSGFMYFADLAWLAAIDEVNKDPTILPNVHVNVKRFSDCGSYTPNLNQNYTGSSGGFASAIMAPDIIFNHTDVIGILGNEFSTTALGATEILSNYKLPYCSAASQSPRLSDRNKYPYFWRTLAGSGLGEFFLPILKKWDVTQVAIIYQKDDEFGYQSALDIKKTLQSNGIRILVNVGIPTKFSQRDIEYVAYLVNQTQARYIIYSAENPFVAATYYEFGKLGLLSPSRVWFTYNFPTMNGLDVGPDYYQMLKGLILLQAYNPYQNGSLFRGFYDDVSAIAQNPIPGMSWQYLLRISSSQTNYDCAMMMLKGFDKLLKSDNNLTIDQLSSRSLQDRMNFTLFSNLGYHGMSADENVLNDWGDLEIPQQVFYFTGNYTNTSLFGQTDKNGATFYYYPGKAPKFSDGSSIPPPDGPRLLIPRQYDFHLSAASGGLMIFYLISGIMFSVVCLGYVLRHRSYNSIRRTSVTYMCTTILAAICTIRVWFQLSGYCLVISAIIPKSELNYWMVLSGRKVQRGFRARRYMLMRIICICLAEVGLLVAWTFSVKYQITKSQVFYVSTSDQPFYLLECTDLTWNHPSKIVLILYNVGLYVVASVLAFSARGAEAYTGETTFISMILTSFGVFAGLPILVITTSSTSILSITLHVTCCWLLGILTIGFIVEKFKPQLSFVGNRLSRSTMESGGTRRRDSIIQNEDSQSSGIATSWSSLVVRGSSVPWVVGVSGIDMTLIGIHCFLVIKESPLCIPKWEFGILSIIKCKNRSWISLESLCSSFAFPLSSGTQCRSHIHHRFRVKVWNSGPTLGLVRRLEFEFGNEEEVQHFQELVKANTQNN